MLQSVSDRQNLLKTTTLIIYSYCYWNWPVSYWVIAKYFVQSCGRLITSYMMTCFPIHSMRFYVYSFDKVRYIFLIQRIGGFIMYTGFPLNFTLFFPFLRNTYFAAIFRIISERKKVHEISPSIYDRWLALLWHSLDPLFIFLCCCLSV